MFLYLAGELPVSGQHLTEIDEGSHGGVSLECTFSRGYTKTPSFWFRSFRNLRCDNTFYEKLCFRGGGFVYIVE